MAMVFNYSNNNNVKEALYSDYMKKRETIQRSYRTVCWGTYCDRDIALAALFCALVGSMILPPVLGFIIGGLAGYSYMLDKKGKAALKEMYLKLRAAEIEYYNNVRKYNKGGSRDW